MAVKFKEIEMAFDFVSFGQPLENEAYIDIESGKIYSEFGDNEEELPNDISSNSKYITLPHKNDLNLGKTLVFNFTDQFMPKNCEKVENIFYKKGAYRKFKYLVEEEGLVRQWHEYSEQEHEKELLNWCKLNGVIICG